MVHYFDKSAPYGEKEMKNYLRRLLNFFFKGLMNDEDVKLDSYLIGDHIIQTTSRRHRNS